MEDVKNDGQSVSFLRRIPNYGFQIGCIKASEIKFKLLQVTQILHWSWNEWNSFGLAAL